jgi:hypothetical protein
VIGALVYGALALASGIHGRRVESVLEAGA